MTRMGGASAKAEQEPSGGKAGTLQIRLLDRMELLYNNQSVDAALKKSKKGRRLIAYLVLLRGAPATVYKLYEALWDEMNIDNPESALKTLVSRTRAMLALVSPSLRGCILAKPGAYCWNMEVTQEIDVVRVEELCEWLLAEREATPAYEEKLDRLLCLYAGQLLPEIATEEWVIVHAIRLEERYKLAVLHSIALFREKEQWSRMIRACRMALVMLPMEEELHAELMRALIMLNRRNEAMIQYRHVTEMHLKYTGLQAPDIIQDMYKEIVQLDAMLEKDIDSISRELAENDESAGAFVCEYAIFKDIYRLQIRSLERFNMESYLAILKVHNVGGAAMAPMVLDEIMQRLLSVLKGALRRGDTITRYTASQYAVLLQMPSHAAMQSILDRIHLAFYQEVGNALTTLEHVYVPLPAKRLLRV